ncbi:MAG: excinuclease ABC subunit UvrC [Phycisphaerales bacterium]|nr:excinuclease ABC subunit UvrC [Phycisphaerales bacterium]
MSDRRAILDRIRDFIAEIPAAPGVYLFKDATGVVLYVGKAKSLRPRVASYFQPAANLAASRGADFATMIDEQICEVDFLVCESEVDALLQENRLVKDIQPKYNERLKDGKTFPYLQTRTGESFPRVEVTRTPLSRGAKLYGPFVHPWELKQAMPLLQRVFKFRTCKLEIVEGESARSRPCLLHSIKQCTAPCCRRVSRDHYASQIDHLRKFLDSKGTLLRRELQAEMATAAEGLDFERAAALRDEIRALENLQKRGLSSEDLQPEAFYIDPADGLAQLGKLLGLDAPPRVLEGVDIAHLQGREVCGSLVCFIDGKPFKHRYRRYKIRTTGGNDDTGAIREVVSRRFGKIRDEDHLPVDVLMIDGGKGQLNAAAKALADTPLRPTCLISLAKKEELIYVAGEAEPIRLPRRSGALRLLMALRDEAHRFAQHYHHILRRKATLPDHHISRKKRNSRQ